MEVFGVFEDFRGTVVTFPANNNTPFTQNWVIDKQLSGNIYRFTKHEIEEGLGPSFAAGKFACHIENGTETVPTVQSKLQNLWATVPGKPITEKEFWRLHPSLRDTIRGKFKVLYRHLCGLRAAHRPEKPVEWNDTVYALYGLI
ncbi:hypothetical protein PENSOL_c019G03207 [Penicillium solitum]|uniref:Uncharacterized protein n=1 Tax=Penicillium solitum TaxID=60172 RepID=A0A1V6R351_9EURO|nr:uncharacterized protein PENSOL_c019G03207 [Penicillium solitum]OQD95632.1 hypothetical protein PENSOL_c019G03207 [Penicillium solitum]